MISCDLEKEKGSSVFHSICSIFNQDMDDFELIIVDNSNNKDKLNTNKLQNYSDNLNAQRNKAIKIKIINENKPLNVNSARNIGAKYAKGDVLVFIEADTIILDKNCFSLILNFSKKFDFGYGAKRYWTKIGWFEKKSKNILYELQKSKYKLLKLNISGYPNIFKRKRDGDVFSDLQEHTFIANFGFCKKNVFLQMNGFPLYEELDLSDDCLIYRLFRGGYKYKFLDDISVAHVSHKRSRVNHNPNLKRYFKELTADNNYWCNISKTFNNKINLSEVIEPLREVHYDYRIKEMYSKYVQLYPLDIKYGNKEIIYWRKNNIFSIIDFSLLIKKLIEAKNIDEFIKISGADFDNLAAVIKIAMDNEVIFIDKKGNISNSNFFDIKSHVLKQGVEFIPKNNFNQFPCDIGSRVERAEFLINRYPFVEYLKFAIIGDDDFLSPLFKNHFNFCPIVLEKDKKIIKKIEEISKDIKVYNIDLTNDKEFKSANIPIVKTFITDPPYTISGALTFIYRGLSLLPRDEDIKEFYIILNPAMIGKNLYKIIKILARSSVYLYEVIENFSQYKLPKNYNEYNRANNFLKSVNLSENIINYSSSSSLYIFRTTKPKLAKIKKSIDFNKIYQHYL
jgi:glycosyltransferase involved in cell wall biosynthesis